VACNACFGHTYIAYVAEVSVDNDGNVRVERVVAAVDCGLVVNPLGVEQQMEGGIIWGISSALKGEITFHGGAAGQTRFRARMWRNCRQRRIELQCQSL
jgi:isoquinoline 1-oxidoreductase beta subunit